MKEVIFYLGSILIANWLVIQFGIIKFAGLTFPAGAAAIGLTFSARDLVQRRWGKWRCWIWMLIASLITLIFNTQIAVASMSAFLISEATDWIIFTLTKGNIGKRIFYSNLLGIPLDSIVFVGIAFGFLWSVIIGQAIIKFAFSLLVILFLIKRK